MRRKVTPGTKSQVATRQKFRCMNRPGSNIRGLQGYNCPLWRLYDDDGIYNNGVFDESGYEIDHINEWSKTRNDNIDNLQALCCMCHRVKTKAFAMNHKSNKSDISNRSNKIICTTKRKNNRLNNKHNKPKKIYDLRSVKIIRKIYTNKNTDVINMDIEK